MTHQLQGTTVLKSYSPLALGPCLLLAYNVLPAYHIYQQSAWTVHYCTQYKTVYTQPRCV